MKYSKDLKQVMTYVTIEEDMPVNAFQSFKATYKKVKKILTEEELAGIENKQKQRLTFTRIAEWDWWIIVIQKI